MHRNLEVILYGNDQRHSTMIVYLRTLAANKNASHANVLCVRVRVHLIWGKVLWCTVVGKK